MLHLSLSAPSNLRSMALVSAFAVLTLLSTNKAHADWVADGLPVCTTYDAWPYLAQAVPDGAGGAFVVWNDSRNFAVTDNDIYMQRLDPSGNPLWTVNGIPACNVPGSQYNVVAASDGAGGFICAWYDERNGVGNSDIYAQRVDADGVLQWTIIGVAVCNATGAATSPKIVADGAGGAIIAWVDGRSGSDIYAQRLNASGLPLWTTDGVPACSLSTTEINVDLVSDGSGGAVLGWRDYRSVTQAHIYAQRIGSLGSVLWATNGVPVEDQGQCSNFEMVLDLAGGAIFGWSDSRNGDNDVFADHINNTGVSQWELNGRQVSGAQANNQNGVRVAPDGNGGIFLCWEDQRTGVNQYDIYANHLDQYGSPQWILGGKPIAIAAYNEQYPLMVSDDDGGAVVLWGDYRGGELQLYAQQIDALGALQWDPAGKAVSAPGDGYARFMEDVIRDGQGGTIVAFRNNGLPTTATFAQRIEDRYGDYGHPEPTLVSAADVPGDQGGYVQLNWLASDRDKLNENLISHYSIWRATAMVAAGAQAVAPNLPLIDLADVTEDFAGKGYRIEHTAAGDYYWEFVGNQDAIYLSAYSYAAPTLADSTGSNAALTYFQVISHADQYTNWPSVVQSASSRDNISPAPAINLTATRGGGDIVVLEWSPSGLNEPDLGDYVVYRNTASGVSPEPLYYLSASADTTIIDSSATSSQAFWYIVTARDVHENESDPSNEAMVTGSPTGADPVPAVTELTLYANTPNPFSQGTDFRLSLPESRDVRLEVFDVAGRRVYARDIGNMPAGVSRFYFAGRDHDGRALASGVYFYRVTAGMETQVQKFVIAR